MRILEGRQALREYVVENEFVKAVKAAGGVAYKLTSQTANGLPDRLVLFPAAKTIFVELKAPGKIRYQLMKLGFPVLCIDRMPQIKPFISAALSWTPGEQFPEGIGAKIPDLERATLPTDMDNFGETLEPIDPDNLIEFYEIEDGDDA